MTDVRVTRLSRQTTGLSGRPSDSEVKETVAQLRARYRAPDQQLPETGERLAEYSLIQPEKLFRVKRR